MARRTLAIWLQAGLFGVVGGTLVGLAGIPLVTGGGSSDPVSAPQSRVDRLISEHRCWTHDAPPEMAGKIPGGLVMQTSGHAPAYLRDPHAVQIGLAHVLSHQHPEVVVYAFCR